ncbi:MAG: sporulation protein YunB [Firmicutes bacterium]|nr:sporulation protein YunB [Bacillota bacterium]
MRRGSWGGRPRRQWRMRSGMRRRLPGRKGRPWRLLMAVALTASLLVTMESSLSPLLLTAGSEQARAKALAVLTAAARRGIERSGAGDYRELVSVERDGEGRAALLLPNVALYNELIADITLAAAAGLEQLSRQSLSLPAGAASGSTLLSGMGPDIRFRLRVLGTPSVRIRDELTAAGINQVRHRIWLEITAELRILAPFSHETTSVTAPVLLAEGLIVGGTPQVYAGLSREDSAFRQN